MEERMMRRVADSAVIQTQLVLNSHLNGAGRLFGGQLMEWIDVVATVVARRHAHCNPTTASVDNLQFKEAVHLNNTLIIEGKLTYVGRTSMEVRVDTFVESLSGARKLVNTAYVVMVALDENEHPMEVPGLLVETDEEKAHKAQVMEKCLHDACEVPLDIMRACCEAIDLHEQFAAKGTAIAISDVGCGVICCKAALKAASLNVFINTGSMKELDHAAACNLEARKMLDTYCAKADEIFADVEKRFS